MPGRIVRRTTARFDIVETATHLGDQNPALAVRFLDAVEASLRQLSAMTEMGSPRHFEHPDLSGLRSWPVKGFEDWLIFYQPIPDGIRLVRVLHGARNLRSIFDGEKSEE